MSVFRRMTSGRACRPAFLSVESTRVRCNAAGNYVDFCGLDDCKVHHIVEGYVGICSGDKAHFWLYFPSKTAHLEAQQFAWGETFKDRFTFRSLQSLL